MKLLVLGGTVFLGRHVVAAACAAGHDVTIFHRGVSGAADPVLPVEVLRGDRDGDVSALAGRSFDAVIDCSGYTPAQLRRTGDALADRVGHYLFVSSRSVYCSFPPGVDVGDGAPLQEGEGGYGALKARSEEALVALLPGRTTIVRPGLIVGPHDPTGRFTYWPLRLQAGGDVLAPGRPDRQVQFVDARDLAQWMVAVVAGPPAGVFDVVGPSMTMAALLADVHAVTGGDVRLHWVADDALLAAGVQPWTELPLWIPESDPVFGGLMDGSDVRARRAGLETRPVVDTVRDTLRWATGPTADTPRAVATMQPQHEQLLLITEVTAP